MSDADDWGRHILDARPLTPERWDALKRAAIQRAHDARMRAVREMLAMLVALPRRVQRRLAERFGDRRPQHRLCGSYAARRSPM
jgi:hypothetical protein